MSDKTPEAVASNGELGPMPESIHLYHDAVARLSEYLYTADQMRAFRAEGVAAERERWLPLLRECEQSLSDMTGPCWPARVEVLRRVRAALRPNANSGTEPVA